MQIIWTAAVVFFFFLIVIILQQCLIAHILPVCCLVVNFFRNGCW